MAARTKKSKNSLILLLSVLALVIVAVLFLVLRSSKANTTTKNNVAKETAKPVVSQNVGSGPVNRNLLSVKSGPKKGEVTLSWTRYYSDYGKYGIVYRNAPGKYTYGVLNAGNSSSQSNTYTYVVGSLKSGTKYYFAIQVQQTNSKNTYVSPEVSVVAP
jgi:hypothetical protein